MSFFLHHTNKRLLLTNSSSHAASTCFSRHQLTSPILLRLTPNFSTSGFIRFFFRSHNSYFVTHVWGWRYSILNMQHIVKDIWWALRAAIFKPADGALPSLKAAAAERTTSVLYSGYRWGSVRKVMLLIWWKTSLYLEYDTYRAVSITGTAQNSVLLLSEYKIT